MGSKTAPTRDRGPMCFAAGVKVPGWKSGAALGGRKWGWRPLTPNSALSSELPSF